jgi:hypothetical protein
LLKRKYFVVDFSFNFGRIIEYRYYTEYTE